MNIELAKSNSKIESKTNEKCNVDYNFGDFEKVRNEPQLDNDELNFDDFDDAHDKPVFIPHEIEPQFQVNLENNAKSEHSSSSSKKQLTFQAKIFPEPNLQLGQSNTE